MRWEVHFFVIAESKHITSSAIVNATDRNSAISIVQAMYGGQVRIRWVEQLG
jgi:hypothetical protein